MVFTKIIDRSILTIGVYAQFDADAAAYEVLYPPNAQHQPPQSETNNNNLKVSGSRLRSTSKCVPQFTTEVNVVVWSKLELYTS